MIPAKALVQHLLQQRGQVRLLAMLADQSPARDNRAMHLARVLRAANGVPQRAGLDRREVGFPRRARQHAAAQPRSLQRAFRRACGPGQAASIPNRCCALYVRQLEQPRAHVSRAVFLGLQPLEAREAAVWLRRYPVRHSGVTTTMRHAPLPRDVVRAACLLRAEWIGLFWLVYRVFGLRRSVIRDNLRRSFPDTGCSRVAGFCDASSSRARPRSSPRPCMASHFQRRAACSACVSSNPALLETAAAAASVSLQPGTSANFEWMLLRVSADLGPRLLALYKPMRNAWFEARFRRLRTRFGANLVPAKSVVRELARFREARAIGIVADQVPRTSPEKLWLRIPAPGHGFFHGPGDAGSGAALTRSRMFRCAASQRGCVRNRTAAAERAG